MFLVVLHIFFPTVSPLRLETFGFFFLEHPYRPPATRKARISWVICDIVSFVFKEICYNKEEEPAPVPLRIHQHGCGRSFDPNYSIKGEFI